ncbi:C-type lectin domain family 4 member M-like [Salvelinus namaycush]|uniref:C-type lectin domain family 4 member M-like n=1 Tax=Salvelinus namaycush TaxID=8040 RepID=A0A8U0U296_SALNM|nr:C-type lectin domain family 4 member M-like [Salvelinus namaycush]
MANYVNKQVIELNKVTEENRNRATRSVKTKTHLSDGRLYRLAAVCFGVLCVLQVTLNISLRLAFCTGREVEGSGMAVPRIRTVLKCPKGWRMLGSSCYFLSTERKTWKESKLDCLARGADLVIINSRQEQTLLYQLDGDADLLVWIGLTDSVNEGTWKWVDGTPLTTSYWKSGQPDHGGTNNEEDCVEVYHRDSVLANWNDAPCNHMLHWICEK